MTGSFALDLSGQTFHLIDLGEVLAAPRSFVYSVNNQGRAAGNWYTSSNSVRGFLFFKGAFTELVFPGANIYPLAINNLNQVAGFVERPDPAALGGFSSQAFLHQKGVKLLGAWKGSNSYALALNNQGRIAGYIDTPEGPRAVLYESGVVTRLGTLGGSNSFAFAINDARKVVGSSSTPSGEMNAFLWEKNVLRNLNQQVTAPPGWLLQEARGINYSNVIVGWGLFQKSEQGFLFDRGRVTGMGLLPGGTNSYALAINRHGSVVGAASADSGSSHAVLWRDTALHDLNGLVPDRPEWKLVEARSINDSGQIVGWGMVNGQERAFFLNPNRSPQVSLTRPTNNLIAHIPAFVLFAATASDLDGRIAKVDFLAANQLIGSSTVPPFTMTWSNPPSGRFTIQALAVDDHGATTASKPVSILINQPPTIRIIQPTNLALFAAKSKILLKSDGADPDGSVVRVEYFSSGKKIGESAAKPFAFTWPNLPIGTSTLTARARDNRGATAQSPPLIIQVVDRPVVRLTGPLPDTFFAPGTPILVSVEAVSPGASIRKVELFLNGTNKLAELAAPPYAFTWANAPTGHHLLTAAALDSRRTLGSSAPLPIAVIDELSSTDDFDQDGASNLDEVLRGTNPAVRTLPDSGQLNLKLFTPLK